ncbi:Ribonuclease Y [uncultured archaeon]|nr:Ribonuclease Y [uncultured archaeon]
MKEKFFEELEEKIQPYFEEGGSHAYDHTKRVCNLALKIGKKEKADLDILKAAALLHDISRKKEDNNEIECHAEHGAEMAEKILKEMNFPPEKIINVKHSIKVHRHSKKLKAETKEAQIIQDADRLDALGAITIARMFSTGGKTNRPLYKPGIPFGKVHKGYYSESTIHGFYAKILKITPESFNTSEAKTIAKERYKFVEEFIDRFLKEWDGKL